MNLGLAFEIAWIDDDLWELKVEGGNGRFGGSANLYTDRYTLVQAAEGLRNFPESRSDVRVLQLGATAPENAGGGARLRFRCLDAAGHVACDVYLRARAQHPTWADEVVEFSFSVEPAAIDSFVAEVGGLNATPSARAFLRSAT